MEYKTPRCIRRILSLDRLCRRVCVVAARSSPEIRDEYSSLSFNSRSSLGENAIFHTVQRAEIDCDYTTGSTNRQGVSIAYNK